MDDKKNEEKVIKDVRHFNGMEKLKVEYMKIIKEIANTEMDLYNNDLIKKDQIITMRERHSKMANEPNQWSTYWSMAVGK